MASKSDSVIINQEQYLKEKAVPKRFMLLCFCAWYGCDSRLAADTEVLFCFYVCSVTLVGTSTFLLVLFLRAETYKAVKAPVTHFPGLTAVKCI